MGAIFSLSGVHAPMNSNRIGYTWSRMAAQPPTAGDGTTWCAAPSASSWASSGTSAMDALVRISRSLAPSPMARHAVRVDAGELAVGEDAVPLREAVRADGHTVPAEVAVRDARVGVARQRVDDAEDHVLLVPEHAEGQDGNRGHDLGEVGGPCARTERGEVLLAGGRPRADVHVEVVVLDVDARFEAGVEERGEHAGRDLDVVVMTVEALAGGQVERERAIEHDGRRREPVVGERFPRGRRPTTGRDQHRHAAAVQLGPRRQRLLVGDTLRAVGPEGAVEIGDDELDGARRAQWRRRLRRLRIARIATRPMNWPPTMMRMTSMAGCQVTSPFFTT